MRADPLIQKFLSAAMAQRLNNSSRTFEDFSELQGISLSAVGRQLLLSLRDIPSLFLCLFISASPYLFLPCLSHITL
jgi:hypothetical protein